MSKRTFLRAAAALYCLSLAVSLLVHFGRAGARNECQPRTLSVEQAVWGSIINDHPAVWAGYGPGSFVSTDNDPQLTWVVDEPVYSLTMTIRSSLPVQDPELYYTTAPGQAYTPQQKLKPAQSDPEAGVYVFLLPKAQQVHALRLDPTSEAGAFFELTQVELNTAAGPALMLTAAELLAALVLPLLAALAAQELALLKKP